MPNFIEIIRWVVMEIRQEANVKFIDDERGKLYLINEAQLYTTFGDLDCNMTIYAALRKQSILGEIT